MRGKILETVLMQFFEQRFSGDIESCSLRICANKTNGVGTAERRQFATLRSEFVNVIERPARKVEVPEVRGCKQHQCLRDLFSVFLTDFIVSINEKNDYTVFFLSASAGK